MYIYIYIEREREIEIDWPLLVRQLLIPGLRAPAPRSRGLVADAEPSLGPHKPTPPPPPPV